MDKLYDVTAIGELLIDFTMNGQSDQGNNLFEACPGGAPCNVLAMLNKLGRKTAFIGKVGEDQFGRLLKDTIEGLGIGTKGLIGGSYNACFCTYVPGRRQRVLLLSQTRSGYDADRG